MARLLRWNPDYSSADCALHGLLWGAWNAAPQPQLYDRIRVHNPATAGTRRVERDHNRVAACVVRILRRPDSAARVLECRPGDRNAGTQRTGGTAGPGRAGVPGTRVYGLLTRSHGVARVR